MEKNLKIEKLSDIVAWADGKIRDGGYYEEKYNNDASTAYCHVKAYELWRIRDVVLESIDRHSVKAAKIDLLEKEIEGRKEGYIALKVRMDTKYISIDDHNDVCKAYEKKIAELEKEVNKWQDLAKMNRDTICDQYNVCEDFKKKIAEIEEEVEKWKKKFDDSRKETIDRNAKIVKLEEENEKLKVDLIHEREKNEKLAKDHAELENDMRKYATDIVSRSGTICNLKKELDARGEEIKKLEEKVKHQRKNLDGINKTLEIKIKENERLIAVKNNQAREIEAHESENARLTEKIIELKKANGNCAVRVGNLERELEKTCTTKELDLKGHNRREMALVNDLADKNDEIKKLEESIDYYKNQERIRTDQLRATERKVDELWGLVNELKKEKKEGDDYVKSGFKLYVKNTLAEAEGDKNEANEVITEAVRSAYTEWGKEQKEKEEETEVKGNGRTSSGRYPWGAKVNDIPCGEDSIE